MIPQTTFEQKSLQRILNSVPDGMQYIIKLKNGNAYYQILHKLTMYETVYKQNISKFFVDNGFIEIYYNMITINTKNNKKETNTTVYFIPFEQIEYIQYVNVENE